MPLLSEGLAYQQRYRLCVIGFHVDRDASTSLMDCNVRLCHTAWCHLAVAVSGDFALLIWDPVLDIEIISIGLTQCHTLAAQVNVCPCRFTVDGGFLEVLLIRAAQSVFNVMVFTIAEGAPSLQFELL